MFILLFLIIFFFISDHELITISFHSIEQFSCRQFKKLYCMFLDMGQLYLHIFTHICLYIYISDILTTYALYICSIQVWHSYQLYLFICICTPYTVMVVLLTYVYSTIYIYLLHIYHIIITYLYDAVITLFLLMLISLFFIIFFLFLIMNWSLSVFIASSSFNVDYCIKLYCMFLDMCQLYMHIFTHVCL